MPSDTDVNIRRRVFNVRSYILEVLRKRSIDKVIPPAFTMARRLNLIHHACCMDDCDYVAPSLTIASNCVERNCPQCDLGGLKTVLPTKVAYEMGDKNTARYEETRHFLVSGFGLDYTTREQIDAALPSNAIAHYGIKAYFQHMRNEAGL